MRELEKEPMKMGGIVIKHAVMEKYLGDCVNKLGCRQRIYDTIKERMRKLRISRKLNQNRETMERKEKRRLPDIVEILNQKARTDKEIKRNEEAISEEYDMSITAEEIGFVTMFIPEVSEDDFCGEGDIEIKHEKEKEMKAAIKKEAAMKKKAATEEKAMMKKKAPTLLMQHSLESEENCTMYFNDLDMNGDGILDLEDAAMVVNATGMNGTEEAEFLEGFFLMDDDGACEM